MMERLKGAMWAGMLTDWRRRAGLTKAALARAIGVSIGYITKLESEKTPPPEALRVALVGVLGLSDREAEQFHVQAEKERTDPVALKYLLRPAARVRTEPLAALRVRSEPVGRPGELHSIPIINKAAAGHPQEFTDLDYPTGVADAYIGVPDVADPNAFAFYAAGDSMEPDFPDGTLLIAAPNRTVADGDPCFVRFSPLCRVGGCTFKRIYFLADHRVRLVPINRRYAEEVFGPDDLTSLCPVVRAYVKIPRHASPI